MVLSRIKKWKGRIAKENIDRNNPIQEILLTLARKCRMYYIYTKFQDS